VSGEGNGAVAPPSRGARRRYVWKLLYVYMLGYDVEFGHIEVRLLPGSARAALSSRGAQAVGLISSPKYAEKLVGYMVTSVLLNEARARLSPRCLSC
jgi:AP-2 complex subunit alpha